MKVKICGITNAADALAATEAGADALGFVFSQQSTRRLTIAAAAILTREVPAHVLKVGVFVDATEDYVREAIEQCGLNIVQLHGNETPDYCTHFPVMVVKAFRIRDAASLEQLPAYRTDAWLLDAYHPSKPGGTGERFDWSLAAQAQGFGRPIFLAGGLTPENVAEAVRQVNPFAVDVSSGVESAPGKKDPARVREFIEAAKKAG